MLNRAMPTETSHVLVTAHLAVAVAQSAFSALAWLGGAAGKFLGAVQPIKLAAEEKASSRPRPAAALARHRPLARRLDAARPVRGARGHRSQGHGPQILGVGFGDVLAALVRGTLGCEACPPIRPEPPKDAVRGGDGPRRLGAQAGADVLGMQLGDAVPRGHAGGRGPGPAGAAGAGARPPGLRGQALRLFGRGRRADGGDGAPTEPRGAFGLRPALCATPASGGGGRRLSRGRRARSTAQGPSTR